MASKVLTNSDTLGIHFGIPFSTPPRFLKRCAGVEKGSARPGHAMAGQVTLKQVFEIARAKQQDAHLSHLPLDALCKSILGSAHSMGFQVVNGKDGDVLEAFEPSPAAVAPPSKK
jgi:ribosomal protein L11